MLQITLPKQLGFAYAKFIDLRKIVPACGLSQLVKIYNYKTEDESYDLAEMLKQYYLLQPRFALALPPTITSGIWKIIEKSEVTEQDLNIPHFSRNEDWGQVYLSKKDKAKWYYCIDASIHKKIKTSFENVQHLAALEGTGTGVLEIEIAMAFLMKEGKKVEDYFELKEYYEKSTYESLQLTPPYYELPKDMRDKAIEG